MNPYTHLFHRLTFVFLFTMNVIIICNSSKVVVMKSSNSNKQSPVTKNATKLNYSEDQFTKWVKYVGSRNHPSSTRNNYSAKKNNAMEVPSLTITVDQNPEYGNFRTIQDAIDSIPMVNLDRVVINVHAGIYTEKVTIPPTKSYITIQGAGAENTVVQWGDMAKNTNGTFYSATFAVNSPFFIARNITFKNTAPVPPPGAKDMQAVALRISADAATFVGCKFLGAQDTLFDHEGRHYYKDCYIQGSIDFIFGDGRSFFENCELHSIPPGGALTAQHRDSESDDSGFVFVNCRVTGSAAVYLGRAWGSYSRVVFAYTYMHSIIIPRGWHDWGRKSRDSTVFYGQYKCSGPGAKFAKRVEWAKELTDEEARPFIYPDFVDASQWLNI
ncbi:hypothetical protein ABFS82_10G101600 [Erythranthe guttata]